METGRECKTWKKKWLQVLSVSDWVLCSTQGYILDSTRLSGRVFVGADITKYGPLEEITCSYQEAWWSFTITDEPIVAAFCAGAFWNINCHTFPFCIRKLPRKLTVVLLFSLATPHPPTLFSPPPPPFFSPPTSLLVELKHISTGYTVMLISSQPGSSSFIAPFCSLHDSITRQLQMLTTKSRLL